MSREDNLTNKNQYSSSKLNAIHTPMWKQMHCWQAGRLRNLPKPWERKHNLYDPHTECGYKYIFMRLMLNYISCSTSLDRYLICFILQMTSLTFQELQFIIRVDLHPNILYWPPSFLSSTQHCKLLLWPSLWIFYEAFAPV